LLFAAALVFTSCSNGSDSGGSTPPLPKHSVNFSVDGGNGTIKAKVDGTEIHSGDKVEQGKIVEFTATADDPATHNVDFWTVSPGTFETGTGVSGSPIAKIKVVQPVNVTVKFKPVGTPPTKYTITFGVSGTGGTLKAEVEGVEISSPYQAERNKTVVFTATPANEYYAVEKWTDGGTDIAAAGAHATYTHTVTADANIAVHFKTAPVDVYVTGTSDNKPYVWKNDAPTKLRPNETDPSVTVYPYAVRSRGKDVYIAGEEDWGSVYPRVWKKDGSLHWLGTNRWSMAYDIAFYKGKTLVAGHTYDGTDSGASITDISDTANPVVTYLCKESPQIHLTKVRALCAGTGKLYAAGYKQDGTTYKTTVVLWTVTDAGTVSELELGRDGQGAGTSTGMMYGLCTAGSSVYVAAGNLWKVEGTTVTSITVPEANGVYALCVCNDTVYAAGQTDYDGGSKAAVWKIEGTNASLYKELSTVSSGVYALCTGRDDLYAAGFYYDTGHKFKPVWWHIAADGTLTENKLGTAEGEALGICLAAQE